MLSKCGCYKPPRELPTRLLDLKLAPTIKLVETKELNVEYDQLVKDYQYAALSYCWGSNSATFTTESSTLNQRKIGFNESCLPLTLLQSVRVAKELGLQYLWVDALCIIQGKDDTAMEDWRSESERMCQVYEGAYITLVAAGSSDPIGGLIRGRPTCIIPGPGGGNPSATLVLRVSHTDERLEKQPISSRAWAFQEWYLPSRLLVFTSTHTHFTCREQKRTTIHKPPTQTLSTTQVRRVKNAGTLYGSASHKSFLKWLPETSNELKKESWREYVIIFAARNLSNPADKLPAIAGLARCFQELAGYRPSEYHAGLWEQNLCNDLVWRREESNDATALFLPPVFRRGRCLVKAGPPTSDIKKARAPSWSWAAVDGLVMFYGGKEVVASLSTCQTVLTDENIPFGQVDSGTLTIRCSFAIGSLSEEDDKVWVRVHGDESAIGFWGDDPKETMKLLAEERKLYLLCITSSSRQMHGMAEWAGIVVVRHADSDSDSGFYHRVGYFCAPFHFIVEEQKEFRIV